MDHRCLYGHRVPSAFTFAIQSRNCPTCGAPTVTLTGYQAARKLTSEAGLDAVAAFTVVRVIEGEWVLTPVQAEPSAEPSPRAPAAGGARDAVLAAPTASLEEDEVVVEDGDSGVSASSLASPEPRITARISRGEKLDDGRKARGDRSPATVPLGGPGVSQVPPRLAPAKEAFEVGEEDFFKGT